MATINYTPFIGTPQHAGIRRQIISGEWFAAVKERAPANADVYADRLSELLRAPDPS